MAIGLSNIFPVSRTVPSGSPFPAGSAYNGLSVDGLGKIVIGQDVAQPGSPGKLLSNREIPLSGKSIIFNSGANGADNQGSLLLDNQARLNWNLFYNSVIPGTERSTVPIKLFQPHDPFSGTITKQQIGIDDSNNLEIGYADNPVSLSYPGGSFISNVGNNSTLVLNSNGLIDMRVGSNVVLTSTKLFELNAGSYDCFLGDVDGALFTSLLNITNQFFDRRLLYTSNNVQFSVGSYFGQNVLQYNDNTYPFLFISASLCQIGDISQVNNGTYISVNDSMGSILIQAIGGNQIVNIAGNLVLDIPNGNVFETNATLGNGAGASAGTLTNAPKAGNPTKWIPISDNGTVRYIPVW